MGAEVADVSDGYDEWRDLIAAEIGPLLAGRDLRAGGSYVKACHEIADALGPWVVPLAVRAAQRDRLLDRLAAVEALADEWERCLRDPLRRPGWSGGAVLSELRAALTTPPAAEPTAAGEGSGRCAMSGEVGEQVAETARTAPCGNCRAMVVEHRGLWVHVVTDDVFCRNSRATPDPPHQCGSRDGLSGCWHPSHGGNASKARDLTTATEEPTA